MRGEHVLIGPRASSGTVDLCEPAAHACERGHWSIRRAQRTAGPLPRGASNRADEVRPVRLHDYRGHAPRLHEEQEGSRRVRTVQECAEDAPPAAAEAAWSVQGDGRSAAGPRRLERPGARHEGASEQCPRARTREGRPSQAEPGQSQVRGRRSVGGSRG